MKKFIAIVALAVLTTAVQAVTYAWSSWSGTPSQTSMTQGAGVQLSLSDVAYTGATSTASIAATLAPAVYSVSELSFAIWSSSQWSTADDQKVGIVITNQDKTILAVSTATTLRYTPTGTNNYINGGNQHMPGPTGGTKAIVSFALDVDLDSTATYGVYFVKTEEAYGALSQDLVGSQVTSLTSDYYYTGSAGIALNGDGDAIYRVALPEPGVMALLALGVGAIALKRKVA